DDVPISMVKTRMAKEFRSWMNERGLAPRTQKNYMNFMQAVIQNVLEDFPPDEYPDSGINSNPFANKKLVPRVERKKLLDFLSPEKEHLLWDYYNAEPEGENKDLCLLCLLMWNTGLSFRDTNQSLTVQHDLHLGAMVT